MGKRLRTPPVSGQRRPPGSRAAPDKRRPPVGKNAPPGRRLPGNPPQDSRTARNRQVREVHQRRKRKRKRNYTLYYILLFLFLTISGTVLSLTVFFNIKTIEVTGDSSYTLEDVLPVLGAKVGDNLFRIDTGTLRENVSEGLLRSDRVIVRRVFPSTLRIEVTDGVPEVQMESGGRYYSISRNGRVLDVQSEPQPDQGVVLMGVDLSGLQTGDFLSEKTEIPAGADSEAAAAAEGSRRQIEAVRAFFSALKEAQISGVTAVDLADEIRLSFVWENRIQVVLGSFSELTYKLRVCKAILEDPSQLPADARGILDAEQTSAGVYYLADPELVFPGGMGGVWNWDDGETDEENASVPAEPSAEAEPPSEEPENPPEPSYVETQ